MKEYIVEHPSGNIKLKFSNLEEGQVIITMEKLKYLVKGNRLILI